MNLQTEKDVFRMKTLSEPDRLVDDILHAESRQWTLEAGHAIETAEPDLALRCLRKGADAALLSMANTPYRAGPHVLDFAWFVALCGDARFADDLKTLAEFNVRASRGDRNDVWILDQLQWIEDVIATNEKILGAVRSAPGETQVTLGKALEMHPSHFARQATRLCDGGLLVAAKRQNRIYLWPRDDPDAPPEPERRPTNEFLFNLKNWYGSSQAGAAWEELRNGVIKAIREAQQQPESSATILDVLASGRRASLDESRGIPLMLDADGNALAFGHLDLMRFHAAAQKPHRDVYRPEKGWKKYPARHTWMVLHSRTDRNSALREVAREETGCVPVTVITSSLRNTDAKPRLGQHVWLPDKADEAPSSTAAAGTQ